MLGEPRLAGIPIACTSVGPFDIEVERPAVYGLPAGPVPDAACQPTVCQLDQVPPPFAVVFSQMAPSVPRTKTSMIPLAGEITAGDEIRAPPRDCHADHPDPYW